MWFIYCKFSPCQCWWPFSDADFMALRKTILISSGGWKAQLPTTSSHLKDLLSSKKMLLLWVTPSWEKKQTNTADQFFPKPQTSPETHHFRAKGEFPFGMKGPSFSVAKPLVSRRFFPLKKGPILTLHVQRLLWCCDLWVFAPETWELFWWENAQSTKNLLL